MNVFNYTIYKSNPYQYIMYEGAAGRYEPVRGDIDDAIEALRSGSGSRIFHLHWEEHCLRPAGTAFEAQSNAHYLVSRCRDFQAIGGKVVWTMHNGEPHELQHRDLFLKLRREIVDICDQVLVHNLESLRVLHAQAKVDPCKVHLLPHASYIGVYEPKEAARASVLPPAPRTIQSFGMIRRYKGLDVLLKTLSPEFTRQHDLTIRFSGAALSGDDFLDELGAQCAVRDDAFLDVRNVPEAEVPSLLRSSCCVILPYERFLTSGVALLALTVGALPVAPATRQMRELLPTGVHHFLFDPAEPGALERAILEAARLSPAEREAIKHALLDRAEEFSPTRTGVQLEKIFDRLLS